MSIPNRHATCLGLEDVIKSIKVCFVRHSCTDHDLQNPAGPCRALSVKAKLFELADELLYGRIISDLQHEDREE